MYTIVDLKGKSLSGNNTNISGTYARIGSTGKAKLIASTGSCKTGADHQHPSFNREGDMILFSNPDANGNAQVCTIDLKQVMKEW